MWAAADGARAGLTAVDLAVQLALAGFYVAAHLLAAAARVHTWGKKARHNVCARACGGGGGGEG